MTYPRLFAAQTPNKAAAIMAVSKETLTYGELEEKANQGAHLLRKLGLRTGDAIAIWIENCLDYFTLYWAAQRIGLYIVPISTRLTSDETRYLLEDSEVRVLITSPNVRHASELLKAGAPDCVSHIFSTEIGLDVETWKAAITDHPITPVPEETAGFHMVYSSGTTGRPKGIRQALSGGPATEPLKLTEMIQSDYEISECAIYLSPAPLYHTAPLVFTTSIQRLGATVIVMDKFTPKGTLEAIESYDVSITQMVPTMFVRLLRLTERERTSFDLSSLKTVIHAAAPCPVDIKHQMIEWLGPILFEYYGGSEAVGSTFINSAEWLKKPGSVGRASWGIIHICNERGEELPTGETGQIYFEGGWDFKYFNDDQKTEEARHPVNRHWATLGDIGFLDEDGYLFLTDRKAFMIISGGVNIYPQEIEDTLISHSGVMDAAVFGIPNPDMGEEVKAVVQPVDMDSATERFATELIDLCRTKLSPVKCPRSIEFARQLPRGENGKLYKKTLRDRYW